MDHLHQIAGYDVVSTLGKGAGSTLYEVTRGGGEVFCLKRVVKEEPSHQKFIDQAVHEHSVAASIDHPLCRKSYKLIRQRALIRTSEVLVLMEMVRGSTLESYRADDVHGFCGVMMQAADGLRAMHEAGYVHADIKPNNMMLTQGGAVKLIDFGQSCAVGTIKERIQGTPDYIAPEQVKRRAITARTDVFNLGATMYWLLTGRYLPTIMSKKKGEPGRQLQSSGSDGPVAPAELNPMVPPALSTLVMDCVQNDPADRPDGMSQVHDRLEIAQVQAQRLSQTAVPQRTAS